MTNNKVNLVTGGAGFIGSHLIDRLMNLGEEVICIDNFSTGTDKNIIRWLGNQRFKYIKHDIIKPIDLNVKNIWHLACPASPYKYKLDPINTTKINFLGTENILSLAEKNNARIFFASSSEIYGDPLVHPQDENYKGNVNNIGPRSCYDEGKRVAESLCFDYKRMFNVEIRVARIFNTYGPRMFSDDGRVISNFINEALKGNSLKIYGNGMQTRSFCYISDLIEGILKLMYSDFSGPINLGNDEEITILGLAELIIKKTNPNLSIEFNKLPDDDPKMRKPNISLARNTLGWVPEINLSNGLDETIKYFDKSF